MAKLLELEFTDSGPDVMFDCPGCGIAHGVWTKKQDSQRNWKFNGDLNKPTFLPSILVRYPYGQPQKMVICHSFITDGMIRFLNDCTHSLAGKTVALPEIK